ncbi:hypothetical protein ACOSP7_018181 [Xanthoceras sorbifolium]
MVAGTEDDHTKEVGDFTGSRVVDMGYNPYSYLFIELLGGTVDSGVPGFSEGVLLGSAAGGEEAKSMVGEPTIGSFLVGSLAVPSGLSFGVRRRVGPTEVLFLTLTVIGLLLRCCWVLVVFLEG